MPSPRRIGAGGATRNRPGTPSLLSGQHEREKPCPGRSVIIWQAPISSSASRARRIGPKSGGCCRSRFRRATGWPCGRRSLAQRREPPRRNLAGPKSGGGDASRPAKTHIASMSRAFVNEDHFVEDVPDRPVSPHPNLVTDGGLALIGSALDDHMVAEAWISCGAFRRAARIASFGCLLRHQKRLEKNDRR